MSHRNDKLILCKKGIIVLHKRKIVWQVLLYSALIFLFPSILRFNHDQQIGTEIVGKCAPKVTSYFFYVNLNKFQETQENICVRDKNKKHLYRNMKTISNPSISLVSEDMLRTSSSWKPKKVRQKGGISSWCKRLRKSQMSTGIGNAIYVQVSTQFEYGEQYLLVPEKC